MATYKGISITQQIEAEDGLNTETDDALLVINSVSVKLTETNNNYDVTYTYVIYKNSSMLGDPINYQYTGLDTSTTVEGDSHVTNTCYLQIGTYLTGEGVSYSYVTV